MMQDQDHDHDQGQERGPGRQAPRAGDSNAALTKRAAALRMGVVTGVLLVVIGGGLLWFGNHRGGSRGGAGEDGVAADIKGKPIRPLAVTGTNAPVPVSGAGLTSVIQVAQSATAPAVAPGPILATNTLQASNSTASIPLVEGYRRVGFDVLAGYLYAMPEEPMPTNVTVEILRQTNRIPAEVAAIDGQAVALKGFMLPMKIEKGLATEMLIMKDQSMCCYGAVPKINEWVSVKMTRQGVRPTMDQAVVLCGKLRVGEVLEDGYLKCIYNLEGDKMVMPTTP